MNMFVFPAFDNQFKKRKRSYVSCNKCRSKRIRCVLTSEYDINGCSNCLATKSECDLIFKPKGDGDATAAKEEPVSEKPIEFKIENRKGDVQVKTESRHDAEALSVGSPRKRSRSVPQPEEEDDDEEGEGLSIDVPRRMSKPEVEVPRRVSQPEIEVKQEPLEHKDELSEEKEEVFSEECDNGIQFVSTRDSLIKILNLPFTKKDGSTEIKKSNSVTTFQAMSSKFVGNTDATAVFIQVANSNKSPRRRGSVVNEPVHAATTGSMLSDDSISPLGNSNSPDSVMSGAKEVIPNYEVAAYRPKRTTKTKTSKSTEENNDRRASAIIANESIRDMLGVFIRSGDANPTFKNTVNYGPFQIPRSLYDYLNQDCDCFNIGLKKSTQYKLIKLYFAKFNSVLPLLSEESSLTTFKNNHMPSLILYALVLLATRIDGAAAILEEEGIKDIEEFDRTLEFKTRTMLRFGLDENRLTLLRTYALLSMYGGGGIGGLTATNEKYAGLEQASMDLSIAIHHAFTLGIHHNHYTQENKFSKRDTSISKAWWCLFILDRCNCLINSRTMLINRRDSSLEFPTDKSLNGLVQAAMRLEKVLSFYQPHGDNRSVPKDIDFDVFPGIKSLDSIVKEGGNVGAECLRRLIVCITIMFAQKRRYDLLDPSKPNYRSEKDIPDQRYANCALQILNITSMYMKYLPVINFIPYAVSFTLSSFLRLEMKPIKNGDTDGLGHDPEIKQWTWCKVLDFLESMGHKFWYARAVGQLCGDFLNKLEAENSLIRLQSHIHLANNNANSENTNEPANKTLGVNEHLAAFASENHFEFVATSATKSSSNLGGVAEVDADFDLLHPPKMTEASSSMATTQQWNSSLETPGSNQFQSPPDDQLLLMFNELPSVEQFFGTNQDFSFLNTGDAFKENYEGYEFP